MIKGTFAAQRTQRAISRVGQDVIIRYVTSGGGAVPTLNPPNYSTLTANGNQLAGFTTLAIKGKNLSGKLIQGDVINVAGDTTNYTVQSDASATSNALTASISPALSQNVTDGAAITITFAADVTVPAVVNSFPMRLIDGTRIQQSDLQVTVPAQNITQPTMIDKVIVNDVLKQIVNVYPYWLNGVITHYTIQAR